MRTIKKKSMRTINGQVKNEQEKRWMVCYYLFNERNEDTYTYSYIYLLSLKNNGNLNDKSH